MPSTSARSAVRRDTLNLRIKKDDRALIDRAAELLGQTRTAFVLEAARRAAFDALELPQAYEVDAKTYARFVAMLDAPPKANQKLRKTMRSSAPWD